MSLIQEFKNILRDLWRHIGKAQLFTVASSLAYTTILSMIPLMAVSFAVFKAFGGMEKIYDTIEPLILDNLAEGASDQAIAAIHGFIDNAHTNVVGIGGMIGLIFTSMSMLSSIEKAINRVWDRPVTRSLFHRLSSYWMFITFGPLLLAVGAGFASTKDQSVAAHLVPNGFAIFLSTVAIFTCVYKWVPSCSVRWVYALLSGSVTAAFWNLARIAYAAYVSRTVSYSKIYGSLSAVPILLLWIYIIWVIVLVGAALTSALQKNHELSKQTALKTV